VQGPEFKLQYHQKKKKVEKKEFMKNDELLIDLDRLGFLGFHFSPT
jgi:hypothetical protein